jgi:protein-S-isoprenylcysteine O-methyltransferase Ste14
LILFTRSAWSEGVFEILLILGLALVITAVPGRFRAILYIGGHKNHRVMQEGPYSVCRHTLCLFTTIGVLGLGFRLGSLVLTALFGGLVFTIRSITARKEEAFLRGQVRPMMPMPRACR